MNGRGQETVEKMAQRWWEWLTFCIHNSNVFFNFTAFVAVGQCCNVLCTI